MKGAFSFMSRLTEASQRLEQALERLDKALQDKAAGDGQMGDLQKALEEARAEHEGLKEVTKEVSDRLDSTIKRLNGVLES